MHSLRQRKELIVMLDRCRAVCLYKVCTMTIAVTQGNSWKVPECTTKQTDVRCYSVPIMVNLEVHDTNLCAYPAAQHTTSVL